MMTLCSSVECCLALMDVMLIERWPITLDHQQFVVVAHLVYLNANSLPQMLVLNHRD